MGGRNPEPAPGLLAETASKEHVRAPWRGNSAAAPETALLPLPERGAAGETDRVSGAAPVTATSSLPLRRASRALVSSSTEPRGAEVEVTPAARLPPVSGQGWPFTCEQPLKCPFLEGATQRAPEPLLPSRTRHWREKPLELGCPSSLVWSCGRRGAFLASESGARPAGQLLLRRLAVSCPPRGGGELGGPLGLAWLGLALKARRRSQPGAPRPPPAFCGQSSGRPKPSQPGERTAPACLPCPCKCASRECLLCSSRAPGRERGGEPSRTCFPSRPAASLRAKCRASRQHRLGRAEALRQGEGQLAQLGRLLPKAARPPRLHSYSRLGERCFVLPAANGFVLRAANGSKGKGHGPLYPRLGLLQSVFYLQLAREVAASKRPRPHLLWGPTRAGRQSGPPRRRAPAEGAASASH